MFGRPCWRRAVLISVLLLLTCYGGGQCCQSGFLRSDVEALVTPQVNKGQVILTVPLHDCSLERNIRLSTSDGSFEVHLDGSVTATRAENIDSTRKFTVWMTDVNSGEIWAVNILLKTKAERRGIQVIRFPTRRTSRRQKREWISPPINVRENEPPSNNPIAIIRSDLDSLPDVNITYRITGPGADKPPNGLFVIGRHTGNLIITGKVDREVTPNFNITGHAYDQFGVQRETPIDLFIKVLDVNDNPPEFTQTVFEGSVEELSLTGTAALTIRATDKDIGENALISYSIINVHKEIFAVSLDGVVQVMDPKLDRETKDLYLLRIEARDLGGNINGLHATTTVHIKILDVNDNIPSMEKTTYEVTVEENMLASEIIRMEVQDMDLEFTDNWLAHFDIIEGNEQEHFKIEVDNRTNVGILNLQKELDFEEMEQIQLVIRLSNKAPYHHTIHEVIAQPITVKVIVKNVAEGIVFKPRKLVTKITESLESKTSKVIGIYQAVSADTGQPLEMIKYAKDRDVANWLIIDSETGKITIDGVIDRESEYVIDGKYTATVLAIINERGSSDTATGTIVINVEDINDHVPKFTNPQPCMCSQAKYLNVTANDADGAPFGAPFHFNIQSNQMWKLGQTDATSMRLVPLKHLWPGVFSVPVWIEDADSKGHTVTLDVHVTDCYTIDHCSSEKLIQSEVELGGSAVALIILSLLLLLLLLPLLLLFCKCGSGFGGKNSFILEERDRVDGTLGQSSIEGGGQVDTLLPQIFYPGKSGELVSEECIQKTGVGHASSHVSENFESSERWATRGSEGMSKEVWISDFRHRKSMWDQNQHQSWKASSSFEGFDMLSGASRSFVQQYINQKRHALTQEWISQPSDDNLLIYNSEGTNSPVGSVGCCSLIQEAPFDDYFLNDLDPKFKMLAKICSGELMTEVSEVATSTKWEQKTSSQPLIQQEEIAKKEVVSSSIMNQQSSGALLLPLKKHYVVTTTIEPSQEESLVVDEQSTVTSQYNQYQNMSLTTDPAMTATTAGYGPGGFQGTVPAFTAAPVVQKNVVVTRSTGAGLGEIQHVAADQPIGQRLTHKTTVVTSSVNLASEGVHDALSKQVIGHVPVTQENLVVTGSGDIGLRETLNHSPINTKAIEKNVTISKSSIVTYKSV
ncbi:desmoglein-4-like [Mobula birostris]|uniref:desmoglein-4-like n=1 Tax=Mobula birostris TaxID=1983395 RepID=UPI003B288906